MRVITGFAGGRRLRSARGRETRPTSDRVKEALFNILGELVLDARVLDLFAGTGALAIEALSRGARSAVLVDNSRQADRVIWKNLELTGLGPQARVFCCASAQALKVLGREGCQFDLIFLDPPYDRDLVGPSLASISALGLLAATGWTVVECRAGAATPATVPGLRLARQETYGDTKLLFFSREKENRNEDSRLPRKF
jgi:16S rRNA (guanine966-N2)-methyltransferase